MPKYRVRGILCIIYFINMNDLQFEWSSGRNVSLGKDFIELWVGRDLGDTEYLSNARVGYDLGSGLGERDYENLAKSISQGGILIEFADTVLDNEMMERNFTLLPIGGAQYGSRNYWKRK